MKNSPELLLKGFEGLSPSRHLMIMHSFGAIATGMLIALLIRTQVEILRLGDEAKNGAMVRFYVEASLIAALGALVVLVLHYFGLDAAACATAAIIMILLALWKVATKAQAGG